MNLPLQFRVRPFRIREYHHLGFRRGNACFLSQVCGGGGAGVTLARHDTSSLMNRYFTPCRFEQTYFIGLFMTEYAFPPIGAGRNVLDFIVLCLENPFLPRWREGLHGAGRGG